MPARKRKVTYPPPRTANRPAPAVGTENTARGVTPAVSINLNAGTGRTDLSVGDRVRLLGTGLYSGETAVIERFVGGVIPAALVRTESGRTRQVRTIDLQPVTEGGTS